MIQGVGRPTSDLPFIPPSQQKHSLMARARAAVSQGLGLGAAAGVDDALVLGLLYACQTDATLLAPLLPDHDDDHDHDSSDSESMAAHMAWIEATPQLGQAGGPPSSAFSACTVLPGELLEALEASEDRENHGMRGFGLSASRCMAWGFGCVYCVEWVGWVMISPRPAMPCREVMAPFLRHVTGRMEEAATWGSERREVEVFFAHDTTLLPTVALLDLIRV